MIFNGTVSCRPIRIGFLVPPDDLAQVVRVAQLSTCLWGGRYNPIIPVFEAGGDRWRFPHAPLEGFEVARGLIDFFEPDLLVESVAGVAERLGWQANERFLGMPRVLSLESFYEVDYRNAVVFSGGIDIIEVMAELYETEFKFERRHQQPFANIGEAADDAFFDVVVGRYPSDEPLQYITESFKEVFSPISLPPDASTAVRQMTDGLLGPLWISRHGLEEGFGNGLRDETFYVFDPRDPGDVIDYWNFRLAEKRVYPINVHWFAEASAFMHERIAANHRPIPGNPYGTKFHTSVCFGASISQERGRQLVSEHLPGLLEGAFYLGRDPQLWRSHRHGRHRRDRKIRVSGPTASFDEEVKLGASTRIPTPSPPFLNRTGHYRLSRWTNVIVPGKNYGGEAAASVYPTNLWSPGFPRLAMGERFRIGREGWVLQQEHSLGYSLLSLQTGRDAIIAWFNTQGIEAKPSEEGQIAAQVITAAGGLLSSGMFADPETLELLGEMAENRADVSRGGKAVAKATPDRSKHINTVNQHFAAREKRSFGYWNKLDYFLDRSVFRAGVRVQCPICSYRNWMDLDALSYRPTCTRCLNAFAFSQKPADLKKVDWFYRVVGPFAAPDFARGAYSVALTLRTLSDPHNTEITWSTGLVLSQLECEIDFVAWHRAGGLLDEERDEPLLVIGEAKSFGRNAIDDGSVKTLQKVAERFPGSVMVVSTLRAGHQLTLSEVGRLRRLARWGRRAWHRDAPINPLIVLTGTELFAEHDLASAWEKEDGKRVHPTYDARNLHTLSELTCERYLGLGAPWDKHAAARTLPAIRDLISLVRAESVKD